MFLPTHLALAKEPSFPMPFQTQHKSESKSAQNTIEVPQTMNEEQVNSLVASMSDDQVRRLLIEELRKAARDNKVPEQPVQPDGFSAIVRLIETNISTFRSRLNELKSGAVAVPFFLPKTIAGLHGRDGRADLTVIFAGIGVLLLGGINAEWLYNRSVSRFRNSLVTTPPLEWFAKIRRLLLYALTDFVSICTFALSTVLLFFLFFNHSDFARLVLFTYLTIVLSLKGILLLSRFLLSPHAPVLRFIPIQDSTAGYTYRWIIIGAVTASIGLLISLLLEMQNATEATVTVVDAITGLSLLLMALYLLLKNRRAVEEIICRGHPSRSFGASLLRNQIAAYWHFIAVPYVIFIWLLWVFWLVVGQDDLVIPLLAIFTSIPVYLLLDYLGQRIITGIFGLAQGNTAPLKPSENQESIHGDEFAQVSDKKSCAGPWDINRFVPIIRGCLSFSIAGLIIFWLLKVWGFDVSVGTEVTTAALKILLVISLAYVGWKLFENFIQRRLEKEGLGRMVDEDADAGAEGGSRIGTLLQISRKFVLIALITIVGLIVFSALGVDITPLLAGAGILGLAFGLGAQSLVKDIISGMFFLVDDAFRIGDYIESGKNKGTVEAISIRALRLRHSRGMTHTIPFSQLGTVTNFSRDYLISKLEFRVPYGTDIDKVRKIIKQINKEISEDEELSRALLSPVKSMGVKMLEDSAMVMRIKFKSKPGHNFLIERQVLKQLHDLFAEKGLEFAARHVIVRLPDHVSSGNTVNRSSNEGTPAGEINPSVLSGAGAAAIAVALAEEEELRKQLSDAED